MSCKCHGETFCPDLVCIGYDDDVPVFVRRDSDEGRAAEKELRRRHGGIDNLRAVLDDQPPELYVTLGQVQRLLDNKDGLTPEEAVEMVRRSREF